MKNMKNKRIAVSMVYTVCCLGALCTGHQAAAENTDPVVICVLDSGCSDSDAEGKNYLGDPEDLSDPAGHGTKVYQILNEQSSDSKIYMLKCLECLEASEKTSAQQKKTEEQAVIQAIYDAVEVYQADVLNISWTLNAESEALHEAVSYAHEQGVILIAAAGNLSLQTPLGSKVYPAAWEETIGVGGVDLEEDGTPVSSLWYLQNDSVFVCADGNFEGEKGTSFAVPRVTAAAEEYLKTAEKSEKSDLAVREYLKRQAEDLGEEGYDPVFGWGYIQR